MENVKYIIFTFIFFVASIPQEDVNEVHEKNPIDFQKEKIASIKQKIKEAYDLISEFEKELNVNEEMFSKAVELYNLGEYANARKLFAVLIKSNVKKLQSMFYMAESFYHEKNYEKASYIFNDILNVGFDYKVLENEEIIKTSYIRLINSFLKIGRTEDACATVKKAQQQFPDWKKSVFEDFLKKYSV